MGILVSLIGLDTMTGKSRFIFGNYNLMGGLSLASVLMGMFAVFVILEKVEEILQNNDAKNAASLNRTKEDRFTGKDLIKCLPVMLQSSAIGVVIGAIPGVGGGVASVIAYDSAKRISKEPEKFGEGAIEGVAAPEAANNAVTGAALIPTLTLGVPGAPAAARSEEHTSELQSQR